MSKKRRVLSIAIAAVTSILCMCTAFAATVHFDIAAGTVTLNDTSYTGYQFDSSGNKTIVTGEHNPGNAYIVYQSTEVKRAARTDFSNSWVPEYDRVSSSTGKTWGNYITDNDSFTDVTSEWSVRATLVGREPVTNTVRITGNSQFDVTLKNVWISNSNGCVSYTPSNIKGSGVLTLRYSGDSRLTNIRYFLGSDSSVTKGATTQLHITAGNLDTLTVGSSNDTSKENYWNAVIGGTDGQSACENLYIENGILWAGASTEDDCTAIGGGGNGFAKVFITGGTTTAVNSSTGATIGGGIGYSAQGGSCDLKITGGKVYAYNLDNKSKVPSVAIGGGSSYHSVGSILGQVEISGTAKVYAKTWSGSAIGGGGSTMNNGGSAKVTIGGSAEIDAVSVGNLVLPAGNGIGGGTGASKGGYVELYIQDSPIIRTGSIGGGGYINTTGTQGAAIVEMSGGKLSGQLVMDSTQLASGQKCYFEMTGGVIDNSVMARDVVFLKKDGGAVWINGNSADGSPVATISGGIIRNCDARYGGAVFIDGGGGFAMTGGSIDECTAAFGGAVAVNTGNVQITGGGFSNCTAEGSDAAGGAIYTFSGDVDIRNAVIDDCNCFYSISDRSKSGTGGAIYISGGDFVIDDGSFIQNCKASNGGGFYVNQGTATLGTDVDIAGCSADNGGAVYVNGGNLIIDGATLRTNRATINGGGAHVRSVDKEPEVQFLSGRMLSNTATAAGGGLFIAANGQLGATVYIGETNHGRHASNLDMCPHMEGNSAASGAGIHIQSESEQATVIMRCGNIVDNLLFNNLSNDVTQKGGVFKEEGGTLSSIPVINYGTYLGKDKNASTYYKVIWHEDDSAGANTVFTLITGIKELQLPGSTFSRASEVITGWEYVQKTDSVPVYNEVDEFVELSDLKVQGGSGTVSNPYVIDMYAVWGELRASEASYILTIPDQLSIDSSEYSFDLTATIDKFQKRESLSVTVESDNDFNFVNTNNGEKIKYVIGDVETDYDVGEIFWRISSYTVDADNSDSRSLIFKLILDEDTTYTGTYEDNLVFKVAYNSGII